MSETLELLSEDENDYEKNVRYKCGLCGECCLQEDVETHSCLQGYANYVIKENNSTLEFYPILNDNQTIVKKIMIGNTENLTLVQSPTTSNRAVIAKKKHSPLKSKEKNTNVKRVKLNKNNINYDDEEFIILEVEKRPPLWDLQLNLEQRNGRIKDKLWQEISDEMNGNLTADQIKTKFKNLLDTYRRLVQREKCPSGSARKNTNPGWHHYNSMSFLRNTCLVKRTVSNCDQQNTGNHTYKNEDGGAEDDNSDEDLENVPPDSIGRRKKKELSMSTMDAVEKIANAFCNQNVSMPQMPEPDEIECFTMFIAHRLRKMSYPLQHQAMKNIMEVTDNLIQSMLQESLL